MDEQAVAGLVEPGQVGHGKLFGKTMAEKVPRALSVRRPGKAARRQALFDLNAGPRAAQAR